MKTSQFKAGQLVTICGTVYRIKKPLPENKRICSVCDMKDNDFFKGCWPNCFRRFGSRMPMRYYYEKVGKSKE